MMPNTLTDKYQNLLQILQQIDRSGIVVCFSGGVDSSLLLAAAKIAGIDPLLAVHFITPTMASADQKTAKTIAAEIGVELICERIDTLAIAEVKHNDKSRCYHCKLALFEAAWQISKERNIACVIDGSNAEDMLAFRPGNQAADELKVVHPLAEAGLNKAEIRMLAQHLDLSNHDLSASPCLASRFPYNTVLTAAKLSGVEKGEAALHNLGFDNYRLRLHDNLCRIEIPPELMDLAMEQRDIIVEQLQQLGYCYITLDLAGLHSGSFDR